ncbi:hypothetical protein CP500_003120 [Tychonema bourrellyi FEM_GT703]|uniref:Uncharacterized protein n=2 Tax=Tychonema bourrellyi TaxID=54313 RepID=A0A2G4F5W4_9CYAN|nr:hypothetical protein CP500_003120 [Tychonema bourrellyi FEM_GT703]
MDELFRKVFDKCIKFSNDTRKSLLAQIDSFDTYLAGSVSRSEALPMSDLDVVYFGDEGKLDLVEVKNIDRIDDLCIPDENSADLLLLRMSPEAGFLDSVPLNNHHHKYYDKFRSIPHLVSKSLWEYEYSRRFNERSTDGGINMKYSVGGYRDILIINLLARCLLPDRDEDNPEIYQSIEILSAELQLSKVRKKQVLNAIALIMLTKSVVLMAGRTTSSKGQTLLNIGTLNETFRQYSWLSMISLNSPSYLSKYNSAKHVVSKFTLDAANLIKRICKENILESVKIALECAVGSRNISVLDVEKNSELNVFPVFACLIHNPSINSAELERLREIASDDPGHYYTNRLLAKSQNASYHLLCSLKSNARFALDRRTDMRYKSLVANRLERQYGN